MLVEISDLLAQRLQAALGAKNLQEALEEFVYQCEHTPNQETIEAMLELERDQGCTFSSFEEFKQYLEETHVFAH
ncbi:hypothetical protein NHP21005_02800 [Helicobacter sp. NHP21005]|nr:hypothetical protein NHP21005_02800 [Helicobacter sp. NHP21005]